MTGAEAVISETTFLDCENLPHEMASSFDKPWHFVAEFDDPPNSIRRYWHVVCQSRSCSDVAIDFRPWTYVPTDFTFTRVVLEGRWFITDDSFEVMVYFGICEECGAVYWARNGPPFRRARRCVFA